MPRKERKGRYGQRGKGGEESLCFRLGSKGKDGEARKERIARKGWQGEEGTDSEERIARKGWRGGEGKDGEVRTARKGWRGEEGKDGKARKERLARKGQRGQEGVRVQMYIHILCTFVYTFVEYFGPTHLLLYKRNQIIS